MTGAYGATRTRRGQLSAPAKGARPPFAASVSTTFAHGLHSASDAPAVLPTRAGKVYARA